MLRSSIPLVFLLVLQLCGSDRQEQTVREGDDVTLSCENVLPDQNQCQFTDWTLYNTLHNTATVVFSGGQRVEGVSPSVILLKNCSLLLHRVTVDQAGTYGCHQNKGNLKSDTFKELFVAFVSQQKDEDRVNLTCSVTPQRCAHEVKWLNNDKEVTEDHGELQASRSVFKCEASVSFKDQSPPSQFYQTLKCEVRRKLTNQTREVFARPPDKERIETPHTRSTAGLLLRHVLLSVGLLALVLSVAAVHLYARVKGRGASERSRLKVNRGGAVVYENVGEPSVSVRLRLHPYEN